MIISVGLCKLMKSVYEKLGFVYFITFESRFRKNPVSMKKSVHVNDDLCRVYKFGYLSAFVVYLQINSCFYLIYEESMN